MATVLNPGADEDKSLVDEVQSRVRESQVWRDTVIDSVHTLRELWRIGPRRFHGDHWSTVPGDVRHDRLEGIKYTTVNRTQSAIVATLSVMTERPMRIVFQPVETADEGQFFANPRTSRMLLKQLNPNTATVNFGAMFEEAGVPSPDEDQLNGRKPLTIAQYEALTEVPLVAADGQLGMNPMFTPDDFTELNDVTAGKALQMVFDQVWDRINGDAIMVEHALNFSTIGTQPILLQWDFDKRLPKLINVDIVNARPDPVNTRVEDFDFLIIDQVMTAEQAKRKFPKHKEVIDKASTEGSLRSVSQDNEVGGRYELTDFGRDMVIVRTMWERGHDFPMADPNDTKNPHRYEGVARGHYAKNDEDWQYSPVDGKNSKRVTGIRQVTVLPQLEVVVENIRCPYMDIPVGWTVNVPIINSPYGLGEPQRLEDIQSFINELSSVLLNHLRYWEYPQEYLPVSLLDAIESASDGTATHSHPGRQIGVPDDLYRQWFIEGRHDGFAEDPPPLPSDVSNLMQLWFDVHDNMSGFVSVLQGRAPTSDASGIMVEQLQQQAKGPIGFKSRKLQYTMERVGELIVDAMVKYLPDYDWTRVLSKYPSGVALAFRDHIKKLNWDITAEVVSGGGATKQIEQQMATQRRMMVPPTISLTTYLEAVDENPEREEKRLEEETEKLAAQMGAAESGDASGMVPEGPMPPESNVPSETA